MPRPKARNYLIEKFGESEEGNNFRVFQVLSTFN